MRKLYSSLLLLLLMAVSTVVKAQDATLNVEFESAPATYECGRKQITPSEIATALGIEEDALRSLINGKEYAGTGAVYIKTTDGRSNSLTGNPPNEFWMTEDGLPKAYDDACWFVGITFNESVDVYVGQMPGFFASLLEDKQLKTTLYLVNDGKEVCFNITLKVTAPETIPLETIPLEGMEKVGEETLEVHYVVGDNNDGNFTVDLATVASLLGCETNKVALNVLHDETSLSLNHTAYNGGSWMTKEGYSIDWGVEGFAIFVEPDKDLIFTNFHYGFNDAAWAAGDDYNVKLYFNYESKYYLYTLHVTATDRETFDGEYKLIETESISMQIVPSSTDWAWKETTTIDLNDVESKIGTRNFVLYTDLYNEDKGALEWSSDYNCDPKPGFWLGTTTYLDTNGKNVVDNVGFGEKNSFGVTYANGVFIWYQNLNQRSAGDTYSANLYLVNEENGKYIQYVVNVTYVESKTLTAEYATYCSDKALDFTNTGLTAYIATGVQGDYITLQEVKKVPANTGVLLQGTAGEYKIPVALGETDDVKDNKFVGVTAETSVSENIYVLYTDGTHEIGFYKTTASSFTVSANTAYLPAGTTGAANLRFAFGDEATGIETVETVATEEGATYNVAGQQVDGNYKGIVIKNGKKYLQK